MIKHNVTQGDVDWMILRSGKPTASEFDNILTTKFEARKGEMIRSYLAAKLAEKWLGGPLASFTSWDMDQGKILEEAARPWLALEVNAEVDQVGFITTDDGRIGCSPDGVIGETGIEIKCLQPTAHVKAVLSGEVPPEYLCQIHGGMFVTGFKSWRFLAYHRHFPKLVLVVERDEEIQEKIASAMAAFLETFDASFARLCEINGGPPLQRKQEPALPLEAAFTSEMPS